MKESDELICKTSTTVYLTVNAIVTEMRNGKPVTRIVSNQVPVSKESLVPYLLVSNIFLTMDSKVLPVKDRTERLKSGAVIVRGERMPANASFFKV